MSDVANNLGAKQATLLKLKASLEAAEAYVDRIGKPYALGKKFGTLDKLFIETLIGHCDEPGAAMRHTNDDFDDALSDMIREKFPQFARVAIQRIRARYEAALKEQHAELSAALAEIHALNAKGGFWTAGAVPCQYVVIPTGNDPKAPHSELVGAVPCQPFAKPIHIYDRNGYVFETHYEQSVALDQLSRLNGSAMAQIGGAFYINESDLPTTQTI